MNEQNKGIVNRWRKCVRQLKTTAEMQVNQAFVQRLQNDLRQTALRPGIWGKLKSELPLFVTLKPNVKILTGDCNGEAIRKKISACRALAALD